MEFGPKEAICNHLLMIMAVSAGGSHTKQRGYLLWSEISSPCFFFCTKAALGSSISLCLLLNANDLGRVALNSLILSSS